MNTNRRRRKSAKQHVLDYFCIEERGSSIGREIRAGVVTFLTMSYILLVNPQILSQVGYNPDQVVVATALSSGVASMIAGVCGNLPFGLAPGTGLSVYLAYGLVMAGVMSKEEGMAACLFSGVLMGIFTLLGVANAVQRLTPLSIKLATVVGMGLLIALIGMVSIHLVVPDTQTVVALGDLHDPKIWLSLGGLALTGSLLFHQIPGSILIGIIVVTAVVWGTEGGAPTTLVTLPSFDLSMATSLDFTNAFSVSMMSAVLAFIFVGIFDISGVMFGMGRLARLTQPDETIPGSVWAFLASSIGSIVGALTGSTPVIVQVETAAGINEGGRTGLTAVTIGSLFFCSVFLAPLFGTVPQTATAPILILVGAMMMGESKKIDWSNMKEAVPAYFTTVMMPFSYSITNGILFGIIMSFAFYFTTGDTPLSRFCGKIGDSQQQQQQQQEGRKEGAKEGAKEGGKEEGWQVIGGGFPSPGGGGGSGGGGGGGLLSPYTRHMERRPSLILPKDAVDELDRQEEAEQAALMGSYPPLATVADTFPPPPASRGGGGEREGGRGGGGGSYGGMKGYGAEIGRAHV